MAVSKSPKEDRLMQTSSQMPFQSNLSRPMVALNNLRVYTYRIRKIAIEDSNTGKALNPRNFKNLLIYPIESKYWILFTDGVDENGIPLRFQDIQNIDKVSGATNIITKKSDYLIEISFIGNKFLGGVGVSLVATIKPEEKFVNEIYERLRTLKILQYDSSYWEHHNLFLGTGSESKKTIQIYLRAPFLADDEEMVWQSLKHEAFEKENKIVTADIITNYRVFQYDYNKHRGIGILLPSLKNDAVIEERPSLERDDPVGTYFVFSYNLTGIKEAGTNRIIGDITFCAQDNSSITFTQITDPETLATVVRKLKDRYPINSIDNSEQVVNAPESEDKLLRCSKCHNPNLPGSNFCNRCGSSLTIKCEKCGSPNPSGSLFCSQCGCNFIHT